ncbi:MAG TPA: glycoside hydrolase 43 family protein [Puia sp.]|nr:glycoside hydrolase 43 family protein [Puia sp.]
MSASQPGPGSFVREASFDRSAASWPVHSDNGDGTYANPVIMADFPDVDVIRVGDTYYLLATTMFTFPGVPLLESHDLVNWSYCTNIVRRMDGGACYDLDGCNRYGHGQWAGSLRYHDGIFYVLFNTLNEGAFLCTATDPKGEWKIRRLGRGFHDCGLLFDDNGKIYVASGYNKIYLTELNRDFKPVSKDSLVFTGDIRRGLEGTHVYHLNGYYYLYCTYGGADGFQVALRSRNIWGPYDEKTVIRETDRSNVNFGIHQGALIQTQTGEWWTMLFIDMGPFGRFPSLQPVAWKEGWPVAGVDGKAVVQYRKPNVGGVYPVTYLPTSDEFGEETLGMQWSWNHNPDPAKWSLKARPGFLRLSTVAPVADILWARNTLTQRSVAKYDQAIPTVATTKMDVGHMKTGDVAGLCVFQDPYAYIGVKQTGGEKYLVMVNNGATVDSVLLKGPTVYLRTRASNATKKAVFEYSPDGREFSQLGDELAMRFSLKIFTGNKFCLFNYATRKTGGYVDFDWFHMD